MKKLLIIFLLILTACSIDNDNSFHRVVDKILNNSNDSIYLFYKNIHHLNSLDYSYDLKNDVNGDVDSYLNALSTELKNLKLQEINESNINESLRLYHLTDNIYHIYIYADNKLKIVENYKYTYSFEDGNIYDIINKIIQGYSNSTDNFNNVEPSMIQYWTIYNSDDRKLYFEFIIENKFNETLSISYKTKDNNFIDVDYIDYNESINISIPLDYDTKHFLLNIGDKEYSEFLIDYNEKTDLLYTKRVK